MSRPTATAALAELNVTPLIDVMLVLLIVFMAVVPVARRQLDTHLPAAGGTTGPPARVPLVRVNAQGLSLDARPVASLSELESRLRERLAGESARRVLVQAAGTLAYGDVVRVLDTACSAGAEQLSMLPARD